MEKKDGKVRICLDPKDLNKAIRREHIRLPTIDNVATRLHGAQVFTELDVRKGFWHVELDEDSSLLMLLTPHLGETHAVRHRISRQSLSAMHSQIN